MKLTPNRNQCRAGVTIVESIAYIALVAFLLMCGVRFFNVVYHHNKAVAKATAYTTSVLDAAKHWRRDVANTKGEPQLPKLPTDPSLKPAAAGGGGGGATKRSSGGNGGAANGVPLRESYSCP